MVRYMNKKARPGEAYKSTYPESIANVVTHAIFIIPALIGLVWMHNLSTDTQSKFVAWIYGSSLVTLFTTSTIFHTITLSKRLSKHENLKTFFHIGDRAVIYLFIASSYTPWLVLKEGLRNATTTPILYCVWIAAIGGIVYQYKFHERYKVLEICLYLLVAILPSLPIVLITIDTKSFAGVWEMFLGGVVYVLGVIFFKSDGRIPFAHALWHCFVFIGAAMHFSAVYKHLYNVRWHKNILFEN